MDRQLAEINKSKLLAEQARLLAILSKRGVREGSGSFPGEYKPQFPDWGNKEDENASEVAQFETNLAVTADLEKKLSKVETALQRIEAGTYGICVKGDEIESSRLAAIPEADTCLKHSQ